MNCEKIRRLLTDSLDRELTPGEKKSVREHCNSCAECREFRKALELYSRAADELKSPVKAPGNFAHGLRQRISQENAKSPDIEKKIVKPFIRRPVFISALSAAAAFAVVFTYTLIQPEREILRDMASSPSRIEKSVATKSIEKGSGTGDEISMKRKFHPGDFETNRGKSQGPEHESMPSFRSAHREVSPAAGAGTKIELPEKQEAAFSEKIVVIRIYSREGAPVPLKKDAAEEMSPVSDASVKKRSMATKELPLITERESSEKEIRDLDHIDRIKTAVIDSGGTCEVHEEKKSGSVVCRVTSAQLKKVLLDLQKQGLVPEKSSLPEDFHGTATVRFELRKPE